ncbi:MAG TPA: adenylate kinase [Vicinamibacterales bacterium]|nr:adenylate kinase [Vicinamibacterales bacterium]
MALNVIMMGPPGAGKGTQAGRFARERGLVKISTGDILREAIKEGTPVGLRAKELMDRGELVDDATMIDIVRERLTRPDAQRGFVLDGFPRTVVQAEALDKIVAERRNGPLIVVDVRVPAGELVRRLASRLICGTCGTNAESAKAAAAAPAVCAKCGGELVQRADDNEQVVLERLKVYERATKPLVDFYRHRATFRVVNGAQLQAKVANELDTVIDDAALVGAREAAPSAAKKAVSEKASA